MFFGKRPIIFISLISFIFTDPVRAACSNLYEQCGGSGWIGSTCCKQPEPDSLHVENYGIEPIVCKNIDSWYSQCVPRCPRDKPCFVQTTRECTASEATDGRGRQYCGRFLSCTDSQLCFDETLNCTCGGDIPCAIMDKPGGCGTPDLEIPGLDICGGGRRRCPAWEYEQCGGAGHEGPTTCQPGLQCVRLSENYSSCQRELSVQL